MDAQEKIREARERLEAADKAARDQFAADLRQLRADGIPAVTIAAELGVTRQRVYQLLAEPKPADDQDAIRARLAELDGRWNRMIDEAVQIYKPAGAADDQRRRNMQAAKRARKGLKRLPTVTEYTRAYAEERFLKYLAEHPDLGFCQVAIRELAEADALRDQLAAIMDQAF